MNIHCLICKKTNYTSRNQIIIIAAFGQRFHAQNALAAIEKAHIIPIWSRLFSKEDIAKKGKGNFLETETLVIELHGIKEIIQLQSLYIESMCRENYSLTVDIISSRQARNEVLQQLHV